MIMECSYAVTAWTQAVEDEHRLLSQVLGVLFAFPQLPADVLAGRLAETAAAVRDRGPDRPAEVRRQGRLLVGRRRPVQGVARLRRHARLRVRRRVRARPRGADPDDGHAASPTARRRRSPRCTASAARCSTATASRSPTPGSRCRSWGCSRRRTAHGRFILQRVPARHAQARRAHARRRRGQGGDRRARRRARPHRRAREARREEGRLTEWASRSCPNDCPRPSGARTPGPEMLGRDAHR